MTTGSKAEITPRQASRFQINQASQNSWVSSAFAAAFGKLHRAQSVADGGVQRLGAVRIYITLRKDGGRKKTEDGK